MTFDPGSMIMFFIYSRPERSVSRSAFLFEPRVAARMGRAMTKPSGMLCNAIAIAMPYAVWSLPPCAPVYVKSPSN